MPDRRGARTNVGLLGTGAAVHELYGVRSYRVLWAVLAAAVVLMVIAVSGFVTKDH